MLVVVKKFICNYSVASTEEDNSYMSGEQTDYPV